MMLCLVTDRRRLAGRAASPDRARQCLVAQVRHARDAGIDLVQLRERDLPAADLAAIGREMVGITRGSRTKIVVNDRVDVAIACGADGVHLRGDSIDVRAVRAITPQGFIVGRSVHSTEETLRAGEVDYLVAGTVFATPSKPVAALLGLEGLAAIVRVARAPVLGIGGVTGATVDRIARTGAAGIAAIGLFIGERPDEPCMPLVSLGERLRGAFDSVKTAP